MDYSSTQYLIKSLKLNDKLIFSIFNHPNESRFKDLFESIKIRPKRKAMSVSPKNIMIGLDKRTSIIIKNIPEYISSEQFKKIVFEFSSHIDFYYVPLKIITRKKLRVAFVNVTNYREIVPIYMGLLYKMKFEYDNPYIQMEICYSKVQGRNHLIKRFLDEFISIDK